MKNGSFAVSSVGTLTDFFALVIEKIQEYTDFTLTESTELSAIFNTHIDDLMLKITDNTILSTSSTNASNTLKFTFLRNNISIASYTVAYSNNSYTINQSDTRTINIVVHCTNDANVYSINPYSTAIADLNFIICKVNPKKILDNEVKSGCLIYGNYYPSDSNSYRSLKRDITYSANGIVMMNFCITYSSTSSSNYDMYVPYMYTCSSVTANRYYLINNKKYFALTSNLLILEQE